MGDADRVHYSISRKLSTGDYENVTITYGYSSDVNKGESLKDATTRIVDVVESFIGAKEEEVRKDSEE